MNYYEIYTKSDVDELFKELGPEAYVVGPDEEDEVYFNGYADVYDVIVSYKDDQGVWTEYIAEITHRALIYALYGED